MTINYAGFFQTSYGVFLALTDPDNLLMVTKRMYPEIARRCEATTGSVERNIRTVSKVAWTKNRLFLEEIAHCPLTERPTASQFISILALYLMEEDLTHDMPDEEIKK